MTALLEKAFAQARQLPAEEQDAIALKLQQTITEWIQDQPLPIDDRKSCPQFGSAKGMFMLSPDFDDPITDFEE